MMKKKKEKPSENVSCIWAMWELFLSFLFHILVNSS